jgi:hypothetical protein
MINYRNILRMLGFLMIMDGLFMMIGIPFSLHYGDDDIAVLVSCG